MNRRLLVVCMDSHRVQWPTALRAADDRAEKTRMGAPPPNGRGSCFLTGKDTSQLGFHRGDGRSLRVEGCSETGRGIEVNPGKGWTSKLKKSLAIASLHVEFLGCPNMPPRRERSGARPTSGVYFQQRYEVQGARPHLAVKGGAR